MEDKQIIELAKEIQNVDYDGLTEQQIVDKLMTKNQLESIKFADGTDILKQIDMSDFGKLSPEDRSFLLSLTSKIIPVDTGFFRDLLFMLFPENSTTQNNLIALFTKSTNKSSQLNLGNVGEYHVKVARELIKLSPNAEIKNDISLLENAHNAVYDVMKSEFALQAIAELEQGVITNGK